MPLLTALVSYHNLRKRDLVRAPAEELMALGLEARRLIDFADAQLKSWIGLFSHPFSVLIKLEVPVVNLLQAVSWPGVILTRPGDYLKNTVHFPGARLARILQPVNFSMPLLEQHIHPGFDAASNMVRTTEQPMCYAPGFLYIILAMIRQDGQQRLRLWDIGASWGDCLLWAGSMLLQHSRLALELRGFEALPAAAAAFRRSAHSLQEAWGRNRRNRPFQLVVEEMAMRDTKGSVEISFPSHSMALATFHKCEERYSQASNNLFHCVDRATTAETLDTYLPTLSDDGAIDLLKVHVQGDELAVLRGARASLKDRVCLLHMNFDTLALTVRSQGITQLAEDVADVLQAAGFKGVLVNLWEQRPATLERMKALLLKTGNPDMAQWRPPEASDATRPEEVHHYELVAWSEQGLCQHSPAVAAALRLWASEAVAF